MKKTNTLKFNLPGILLVVALATILIFAPVQAHQVLITSVGWVA